MNNIQKSGALFFLLMIGLSVAVVSGCKEDDDDHLDGMDSEVPQFSITSPTASQVFLNGDTVFMRGTLTDNLSLHDMDIVIKDAANDSMLYTVIQSVHDLTSYDIDFFWKSSVSDHTNAMVIFSAEDHTENVALDTVHIHIMP